MASIQTIKPNWPPIANVHALVTTREGGVSTGEYSSLNLAEHVGDSPAAVRENRRLVAGQMKHIDPEVGQITWLTQVHGISVSRVDVDNPVPLADAAVSYSANVPCAVMTADCLSLFIAAKDGSAVAAVHAGWKGLANGVIEAAVAAFQTRDIQVWLGPCIGANNFEIGPEVAAHFPDQINCPRCFQQGRGDRWNASLTELAKARLASAGILQVFGGDYCSYDDPRLFSHRQATHAGATTGRFASIIWISEPR